MKRIQFYLPEALTEQIDLIARMEKKSKAEVMRIALEAGIKVLQRKQTHSAKALLDMAMRARELLKDDKLPRDLSINHDNYTWGGKRRVPFDGWYKTVGFRLAGEL